jgi:hypothetical protein
VSAEEVSVTLSLPVHGNVDHNFFNSEIFMISVEISTVQNTLASMTIPRNVVSELLLFVTSADTKTYYDTIEVHLM